MELLFLVLAIAVIFIFFFRKDIKEKITKAIIDESLQTTEEEGKKVEEKCGVDSS